MNKDTQKKSTVLAIPLVLAVWVAYTVSYLFLSKNTNTAVISGYLSLLGQAGLDIALVFLCLHVWREETGGMRKIYLFFMASFICAFLADTVYNVLLNIQQLSTITNFQDSLFDIPFIFFLFFQNCAWGIIFFKRTTKWKPISFFNYIPYIIVAWIVFFGFVYGIHWKIQYFSILGIYQIVDTLLEVAGFLLAAFCLARAATHWLKYVAVGYLLIVATDFLIRYNVVEQLRLNFNPFETTWVLGLLFIAGGFFFLKNRTLPLKLI